MRRLSDERRSRSRRAFIWRVEAGGLAYNHTLLTYAIARMSCAALSSWGGR